jgi:hypothetical protein
MFTEKWLKMFKSFICTMPITYLHDFW